MPCALDFGFFDVSCQTPCLSLSASMSITAASAAGSSLVRAAANSMSARNDLFLPRLRSFDMRFYSEFGGGDGRTDGAFFAVFKRVQNMFAVEELLAAS